MKRIKLPKWMGIILSTVKRFAMMAIPILFIVTVYQYFGKYGLLGLFVAVGLVVLIRGIKQRAFYMGALRRIEESIWKKPLDKMQWQKGEMGNTKVKIIWKDPNRPKKEKKKWWKKKPKKKEK